LDPLNLVHLRPLMELTSGRPEVRVGLIDGPVLTDHPELAREHIQGVAGPRGNACGQGQRIACMHGTFVAGILSARRGSSAPAICPDCTLLVRPIFRQTASAEVGLPSATPEELATAIVEVVEAGARVINLSIAISPSLGGQPKLEEALAHAASHGVVVVAAAGNEGTLGGTAITRHPWVIPVASCDLRGRPLGNSNLGASIGKRGLCAPGEEITSLGSDGKPRALGGTSAATPFVTGAIALLWSQFPAATATEIRLAVSQGSTARRATVVPPLLDAWRAHQALSSAREGRSI
jgi:subtilisin family serine protease